LEEALKEIARLQALLEAKDHEHAKEKTSSPPAVSDNHLIISLQHQVPVPPKITHIGLHVFVIKNIFNLHILHICNFLPIF
jgi:hypothetical protein